MIVFGQRMFGKVDQVPGVFYVATTFVHIQFLPLVPTQSWLVLAGSEESGFLSTNWRGVSIPLNGKSILFAWMRVLLLAVGAGGFIAALIAAAEAGNQNPETGLLLALFLAALGVLGIVMFFLSYRFSRPSHERAVMLAAMLGMPPHVCDHLRPAAEPGDFGRGKSMPTTCPRCNAVLKPWQDWESEKMCENCGKRVVV